MISMTGKNGGKALALKLSSVQTSKLILVVDFVVAILLAIAVTTGAYLERDMSQVAAIAVGWDSQLAIAVGFYYWKAKNENRSKHAMELIEKLAGEYGLDSVSNIASIILKD